MVPDHDENRGGAWSRLARHPLVHFVLIGVAIGLVHASIRGTADGDSAREIRITGAEVERLAASWQARWSRPPTPEELDGLVRAQVREIALHREALALGLDEGDPVVRRVLGQKLEGIARDLVELSLSPTDQELAAYFETNRERYRPPPLITFTQVFLDPDRRGDRTLEDAARMLADLQGREGPPADVDALGDSFMLQSYYPEKSEQRIQSLFGSGFAESVFALPIGRWHGPILSGYGTHIVYVHALQEFPPPDLSQMQEEVVRDWTAERREEITDQYFEEIVAKYDVVVEPRPAGAAPGAAAAAGS